jgi:hypothetical protein
VSGGGKPPVHQTNAQGTREFPNVAALFSRGSLLLRLADYGMAATTLGCWIKLQVNDQFRLHDGL